MIKSTGSFNDVVLMLKVWYDDEDYVPANDSMTLLEVVKLLMFTI